MQSDTDAIISMFKSIELTIFKLEDALRINIKLKQKMLDTYGDILTTYPLDEEDDESPVCKSCGVSFRQHLGIQGTCKKLEMIKEIANAN